MEKELENIGLNEKEAKVYVTSLQLGRSGAQDIANKVGLKRPTTYFTIESLMKKGLMSSTYEGKKQFFMAENPERLEEVFQAKKDELSRQEGNLNRILPELKKMQQSVSDVPLVKYYTGKEGVLSMIMNSMDIKDEEDVWMMYSGDQATRTFTAEEREEIKFSKYADKLRIRGIYSEFEDYHTVDDSVFTGKSISKEEYPIEAVITVHGTLVKFHTNTNNISGLLIDNKHIAQTMKSLFKLAWGNNKGSK